MANWQRLTRFTRTCRCRAINVTERASRGPVVGEKNHTIQVPRRNSDRRQALQARRGRQAAPRGTHSSRSERFHLVSAQTETPFNFLVREGWRVSTNFCWTITACPMASTLQQSRDSSGSPGGRCATRFVTPEEVQNGAAIVKEDTVRTQYLFLVRGRVRLTSTEVRARALQRRELRCAGGACFQAISVDRRLHLEPGQGFCSPPQA